MVKHHVLDKISFRDIKLEPQRQQAIADYCWDHYSYFAHQRSLIFEVLKETLSMSSQIHIFEKWQRVVSYKYTLHPLSTKGSILSSPGGRFNIGDIDKTKFPCFPALYLAENRDTAYKERFGSYDATKKQPGLSSQDLALTNDKSITIVCVDGQINQVLDLNNLNTLKNFFNVIKNIILPKHFIKRAKKLNIDPMPQVQTVNQLKKTILDPNWRLMPTQFDVPANSQILGQIAYMAGLEAIVYPSRMSNKDNCLAIFPENLSKSTSFIELVGEMPNDVKHKRLDSETFSKYI